MRILIDATCVIGIYCGYETFVDNLLQSLLPLLKEHEITLLIQRKLPQNNFLVKAIEKHKELKIIKTNIPVLGFIRLIKYIMFLKHIEKNFDLYHCLHSNPLPCNKIKSICTLHDLSALKIKSYFEKYGIIKRIYLNWEYKYLLNKMNKIICVSNSTKKDAEVFFNLESNKFDVIYEAAGELSTEASTTFCSNKYFLTMGSKPHKNIGTVVKSFTLFSQNIMEEYHLIIVGKRNAYTSSILNNLGNEIKNRVILLESVSDKDLASLYRNSLAFIFVSYYEGFGLPILEAMSKGTPVITSNTSSMPEVAGDASFLVSPNDYLDISAKMYSIASSEELRKIKIEKGYMQAKKFSWQLTGEKTYLLYKSLMT